MSLVVTPASATANSYLTVAEADEIAEQETLGRDAESWLKSTASDKERALRRATREVDAFIVTSGTTYASDQALLFPRVADLDANDAPTIIPNVRLATFYQAMYVLHNANVISDADSRRARGLTSFSDDDGSGSINTEPQRLSTMARGYLGSLKSGAGRASIRSVPLSSSYSTTPSPFIP